MRTTLTLDEDVARKLRSEARRSGRTFRDVVNDMLRRGLETRRRAGPSVPFKIIARDLGKLKPGIGLDSVSGLLEQVEGTRHR